jgi:hypothetical protein
LGAPVNVIRSSAAAEATFRVRKQAGVWSVAKNGLFYGDYLTRAQALDGAQSAARTVEALGGAAQVLEDPGGAVVDHRRSARRS